MIALYGDLLASKDKIANHVHIIVKAHNYCYVHMITNDVKTITKYLHIITNFVSV